MIHGQQFSFERGERVIFKDCSFMLHAGQRIGIVGRNGAGKSTLFELLKGTLQTSAGELTRPDHWRITHMAQEVTASPRTALDFVLDGDEDLRALEAELERAETQDDHLALAAAHDRMADLGAYDASARAGTILYGLGFNKDDLSKPHEAFSGGWRIRLSLAQALMRPTDLLLLDEPTNHLDLEATVWLEGYLAQYPGTLLVIAHDRAFLDTVTTHTLHLHQGSITPYKGNYTSFEAQRLARMEQQQALARKQEAAIAHMTDFVRRFRAKASKAKQAQSRLKALERMEKVAVMQADSPYRLSFPNPAALSTPLLTLRELALGYGERRVLDGIKASVMPGDRIGVLGENGAGKSTLLKAVVGELSAQGGEIVRGKHSQVGYFAQHQLETLDRHDTALATYRRRFELTDQQARDALGHWGFDGTMVERPIDSLSGGEKARLVLAIIAREEPAILVLDEPTNHLDLDMREALAVALQAFDGALLLVSHDRSLLERCVDEYWIVRSGRVDQYADTVGDYAQLISAERNGGTHRGGRAQGRGQNGSDPQDSDTSHTAKPDKAGSGAAAPTAAERRRQAAAARRALKPLKDEQRRLEATISKLEGQIRDVEAQLADPESYASLPADEIDALMARSGKLRKKLDDTEQAWLGLAEQIDSKSAG
ncbi:MAG: ATP-binding cassette domain-containing protein [Pseudomonadota bacterium]